MADSEGQSVFQLHPRITLALFSLVSLVLVVLLLEFGVRFFVPLESTSGFFDTADDGRAIRVKPDYQGWLLSREFSVYLQTNDQGIRDTRSLSEIRGAKDRIMVMGDSFAFGVGVNFQDLFSTRLQEKLRADGADAAVFSTGFDDGFGPVQYEYYLEKFLDQYDPHLVVMALFAYNDFHDHSIIRTTRGEDGRIVKQELAGVRVVDGHLAKADAQANSVYVRFRTWLFNHSVLYVMFRKALFRFGLSYEGREHGPGSKVPYFFLKGAPQENDALYKGCLQSIQNMAAFLKARNKDFVVMYVPTNFQIAERYESLMYDLFGYDKESVREAYGAGQPQGFLQDFLGRHGIRFLDLTESLRQAEAQGQKTYYEVDAHWTPAGHACVAAALRQYLLSQGLAR